MSGSIAANHPISSYGLDAAGGSFSIGALVSYALQQGVMVIWEVMLYAVRGVLLLLEWAFSLDLVNSAMGDVQRGLDTLHNHVFGIAWELAAIGVAGLWGLWHGLVQRKAIETVGGLAATVALMAAALVIIAKPADTIGHFATLSQQAALGTLSAATTASVDQPASSFAQADRNLFAALVLHPWCALEFDNIDYCTKPQKGTTIADIWLAFPAGSAYRQALYNLTTTGKFNSPSVTSDIVNGLQSLTNPVSGIEGIFKNHTSPTPCNGSPNGQQCLAFKAAGKIVKPTYKTQSGYVQIQHTGVMVRLALLALICVGLVGNVGVLLWLGLKLVFASIVLLLLMLSLPVVMLLAAFGQAGRATVLAVAKRIVGMLASYLVFATLLALYLLLLNTINNLHAANGHGVGFLPVWLLTIVLAWGVLLKRKLLVSFITADKRSTEGGLGLTGEANGDGMRVMSLYYGANMARSGVRAATAAPRGALRFARGRHQDHALAESGTQRDQQRRRRLQAARERMGAESDDRLTQARATVAEADDQRLQHKQVVQEIGDLSSQMRRQPDPDEMGPAIAERDALLREQVQLERFLYSPKVGQARSDVQHLADPERPGQARRDFSDREVSNWAEKRVATGDDQWSDLTAQGARLQRDHQTPLPRAERHRARREETRERQDPSARQAYREVTRRDKSEIRRERRWQRRRRGV